MGQPFQAAERISSHSRRHRRPTFLVITALATALLVTPLTLAGQTYNISTFAGGALPVNIPGTSASLYGPQSAIAVDSTGNIFFGDGNTVLRLDAITGVLTLAAGNGTQGYSGDNGPAVSAQLHNPYGVALDSAGNLYIASFYDHVVRKVSGGVITTVAGNGTPGFSGDNGAAISAQLNMPFGIAFDSADNLYIADYGNSRIREVSGGVITTVAGSGSAGFSGDNGPAIDAQLNAPHDIAVDAAGNLYIADCGNNRIREVSAGVMGTVAGNGAPGFSGDNGPAISAQLNLPCGVALDSTGNIYIADYYNNRVRRVSAGVITTVAGKGTPGFSGDNGPATSAQLNDPFVVAVDSGGNLYISDYGNNRIREVSGGAITTVAGNGTSGFSGDGGSAVSAQLHYPYAVALDSVGGLYTADYLNNRIRKVSGGLMGTVAGNGTQGFGGDNGPPASAQLNQPTAIALDSAGNLYIADSGNSRIRKVSGGAITTVAGNGTAGFGGDGGLATSAQLDAPGGIAVDLAGNLYIADSGNNRIRKVSAGTITTVAGSGLPGFSGDRGSPTSAQLNDPSSVALDSAGNLYIADTRNNRIRKVSGEVITTVAGNGTAGFSGDNGAATSAQLSAPGGIMASGAGVGSSFYIADTANNCIRRVSGGTITTIAGGGVSFGDNGLAISGELGSPLGVALDSAGNLYIADTQDNRIRLLTPVPLSITGPSSLPAGTVGAAYSGVTFTATGGDGGYSWSATGLPKGMAISAAGALSGTPTVAAISTPQFTVNDSGANTASSRLSLSIVLPTPVVSNLSPGSATVYGAAFTLTVNGSNFLAGATLQWNGSPLATRVVSATQLTAAVAASLIGTPGSAIIVVNSGGNSSAALTFPINAPTPVLSALSPAFTAATGGAFTLTLTGTGFVQTSQVEWNGSALPAVFVSSTQLTASVSASLIGSAGSVSIVVNSGGASSNPSTFTIDAPPSITSLSPASATVSGAAFTLTVTGTGFISGAVLQWNGSPLSTKVVSGTQLTASVSASLIAGPGSATIGVVSGEVLSVTIAFPINDPTPAVTTLSPVSAVATNGAFTVTVTGTGFVQSSQVEWNGSALASVFVSSTQLTASVPASLIASAGSASIVVNSGGASSNTSTFTIGAPPAIASVSPASATAYGPAFTLAVTGTGFAAGATVQWNGSPLATKVVSVTQLTASVPASLVLGAGSVAILVESGGVSSAAFPFPINVPPPAITSLSPASAIATGAAFTVIVTGTGFAQNATVQWNGSALSTTFVSPSQLTAYIAASLIATAGSAAIVVDSGGASSNTGAFPINAPPAITTLNPASVVAASAAFTLTVKGTGFAQGSQVQWNGSPLTTTFVSATQLTAPVSASLVASAGSVTILVNFSGVSSNGIPFPIDGPPAIASLSPAAAVAGGAAFTLTVNGTGFVSGATVSWNGTALSTKFVSAVQLTASVSASLIGNAGTATIMVNSGGVSAGSLMLPINAPPVISSLNPATVAGTGAAFTLTVNGTGFLTGATVQWNGRALTTTYIGAVQLTAAVPANMAAGVGSASVVATNPGGASSAAVKLPITAAAPAVTPGGVVPVYSTASVIQPGSWVSIYGTGLAAGTSIWTGNYPTSLGGTSVTIDKKPAYLWFVSPTQINLQAPDDTATGTVNVVVTTASGSVTSTVTLSPYGPSFSLLPGSNYAAGVILTPDGSGAYGGGTYDLAGPVGLFAFKTRPVKAGETLELFGVGFGPTSPAVPAGKAFSGTAPTTSQVAVTIGGTAAQVLFSGATASGVYQFNIVVPAVGSGDQVLQASVARAQTPGSVLITVQ